MGIVYKAINKFNDLVYIGSTSNSLYERKKGHRSCSKCTAFKDATEYYGFDAFIWTIIYVSNDLYDLNMKEKYFINKYESYKEEFGYNLYKDGKIPDERTRKRMGESRRGIPRSEETKRKISESHKGMKHTEESKEKIRLLSIGRKIAEETKKKISKIHKGNTYNLGRKASDETKRKMSESHKGENNHFYGKIHSNETKRKMSESHKGKKNKNSEEI